MNKTAPIKALPKTASGINPAAKTIPTAILQKRNAISEASLMAVRNRTIDNAPTIPKDSTMLLVTAKISKVVIIDKAMSVTPKLAEYMTPAYVFLYTKAINSPNANDKVNAKTISNNGIVSTFSKKFDLKTS